MSENLVTSKNKEGLHQLMFEFEVGKPLAFGIKELPKKEMKFVLEEAKERVKNWKKEDDQVDEDKFWSLTIRKCVYDWDNLTNNDLPDILNNENFEEKNGWNYLPEGAKDFSGSYKIEFSKEIMRTLAENPSEDFLRYLLNAFELIKGLRKADIRKKLKN